MPKSRWVKYTAGMPTVRVEATSGQASAGPLAFIVDTGATTSFLPHVLAGDLRSLITPQMEQSTGLQSANGQILKGVRVAVEIRLVDVPQFPVTTELMWISRGVTFCLLGQTWLQKVGVNFQNFPKNPKGPRFALYGSPYGDR